MSQLGTYDQAMDAALHMRDTLGLGFRGPLSPFDICESLGLSVRLVEVASLEGMYIAAGLSKPTILVSTLRPLGRRSFTCAHELGHHVFGDGSTTDELRTETSVKRSITKERRADSFAGHLLMPKLAVARSFTARNLKAEHANPSQVFSVACEFGVGYTTMVYHLGLVLALVSWPRMQSLLRVSVAQIKARLIGKATKEQLIVADLQSRAATLDAETGTLVLLPSGAIVDTSGLEPVMEVDEGRLFQATNEGIHRVSVPEVDWAVLLRVSRAQYTGLARFRHIEDDDHDR